MVSALAFRMAHYLEPQVIFRHSISASFEIALGGLAAWLMFFHENVKNFIARLSRTSIALIYGFFVALILFQNYIFNSSQLIVIVLLVQLFALFVIVEQNYATNSPIKLGKIKWVSELGRYSYGFFCYHIVCIRLVEAIAIRAGLTGPVLTTLLIPLTGFFLTIAVGIASYRLCEIHFLNLKKRFSYLN
jgi:peptidoglycan/LPS O-acetylase OafA/YrhL